MIVLLLSRLEHGGLERVQLNLATELFHRGHAIEVWAGVKVANTTSELPADVIFREISPKGRFLFPFFLFRMLRRLRPKAVVTTSNDVACLMLLLRRLLGFEIRILVTQHLSISAPRQRSTGLRRLKLNTLRLLMRFLYPRADQIIAVSSAVARDMQRELGLSLQSIRVIHNPIVTPEFPERMGAPIAWPWPDHLTPTIVYVGRLSSEKRLDLLFRSFVRVKQLVSCRLLIVGTGEQASDLQHIIAQQSLIEHCRMIGFVQNPLPYIKASTVLALCSDYEGFGNVLVEAMACGTQVVTTNCPDGPAEVVDEGKYGQLVPPGDTDAMAMALLRALTGETNFLPADLLRRANEFSLAKAVDAYVEVLVPTASPIFSLRR